MFEGLLQPSHLLVILGVALFVLGPKKLPEMGKGLGEGIRGFKAALKSEEEKPKPTIEDQEKLKNDQDKMKNLFK